MPRPAGLEWMEDWAVDISDKMLAGQSEQEARQAAMAALIGNVDDRHVRWALRDGTHRGRLLVFARDSVLEGF